MGALPYMQIFTGDYIRDTRRLSLEARGAYADALMFLWNSKPRGVITGSITEFSSLLGVDDNKALALLTEITDKTEMLFEALGCKNFRLTDPVMIAKQARSATKAAAGRKGMARRYDKWNSVISESKPPDITKTITNSGNGISNNNSNENNEKGGAGEKNGICRWAR